jgi:hypothetical protein
VSARAYFIQSIDFFGFDYIFIQTLGKDLRAGRAQARTGKKMIAEEGSIWHP